MKVETVGALLQAALDALAPIESPSLTAEVLLAYALRLSRTQLLTHPEKEVPRDAAATFSRLVARAATGEPLAYLIQKKEFCGLEFYVDANVLVPRPETELLVELAEKFLRVQTNTPFEVVDVGTGSGCIAVTLATKFPTAHITAIDISPAALAVAQRNAHTHHVAANITFVQSDLLSAVPRPSSPITLLCANLPYIATDELATLPVIQHEPRLALDGGPDGLHLVQRLLEEARPLMAHGGQMLLEIGATQRAATYELARSSNSVGAVTMYSDFAGLPRVVAITT